MLNHDYFTPNEVSKVTSVSTRTLRYYHEIGLLVPSYIDDNGYRYYHSQDISKLQKFYFLDNSIYRLRTFKTIFSKVLIIKCNIRRKLCSNYSSTKSPESNH